MIINNKTEIADLSQRSIIWLLQLDSDLLSDWFSLLIGLYLCEALSGLKGHSGVERVAQSLSLYLESSAVDFDPEEYAITQLLLIYYILYSYDLPGGSLEKIARETSECLLEIPEPIPQEYRIVQLLLYRVELFPVKPVGSLTADDIGGELDILLSDTAQLYQICNQISHATLGGTVAVVESETVNRLRQTLVPIAMQNLRTYDLDLGCMLLRSLNYLGLHHTAPVQSALGFLEFQQSSNGAFGYFASPTTTSIYLNTTINCLWTIAELRLPNFRLFF